MRTPPPPIQALLYLCMAGVNISQLVRYARVWSKYEIFLLWGSNLAVQWLRQTMSHGLGFEIWFEIMAAEINQPRGWTELIKSPRADRVFDQLCPHPMSMSGSYPRKSVSNLIITLYAKLYQIVIETNLICDVIIINNKIRHNSFTIFTTRRVLHTEPYFLQNIFILSVWPLRGHLAARGVNNK